MSIAKFFFCLTACGALSAGITVGYAIVLYKTRKQPFKPKKLPEIVDCIMDRDITDKIYQN